MFQAKKFLSKGIVLVLLVLSFFIASRTLAVIHDVSIIDFAFEPQSDKVTVGDTVRWTNNGASLHTSTSNTGVWNSPNLNTGQSFIFQFNTIGSFPYHCAIHTSMTGTIVVKSTWVDDDNSANSTLNYSLKQNFPNPFNTSTLISFFLPKKSKVKLEIYNLLGQKLKILLEKEEEPGLKTLLWNGTDDKGFDLPTGVYFYQLLASDFKVTRKMVYLK